MLTTTIRGDSAPVEGQGLSIAHGIVVKKHGETLNFETGIGKGTTFVIRLSLEQMASAPKEAAP